MQQNKVISKAPTDLMASLNNAVETDLNKIKTTSNKPVELTTSMIKHKKHNHQSCKGCNGICCKKEKKQTD